VKFRGISAILVATVVAFAATTANAAKLGFIAAQSSTGIAGTTANAAVPAGSVLYTVALKTTLEDGVGSFGISFTFNGIAATSPVNLATSGAGNIWNVQQLQDAIDAGKATASASQNADSWLYAATGGQVLDGDGIPAAGNPGLNIPGLSPNLLALAWSQSNSPNTLANTLTGVSMSLTGLWGNPTSDDPAILAASLIGPGIYPVAQFLVPAGSTLPLASGDSLGIAAPNQKFYNALGGEGGAGGAGAFLAGDPTAWRTNGLALPDLRVPEPSTIVLAGLGIAGVLFARRRRS